jgi:FtsP/CotA-like multicopper oxidase with cupredoxin domain
MRVKAGNTQGALICAAVALGMLLSGCTSSPEPQTTANPTAVGSPSGLSSAAASRASSPSRSPSVNNALTINITISGGKTTPSGQKINVHVGETVVLNVTSDSDDEIHAHTGGNGYELEVKANEPTRGTFTVPGPGSFEVESHHLEKIIAILNAR